MDTDTRTGPDRGVDTDKAERDARELTTALLLNDNTNQLYPGTTITIIQ
jgi:hypothetical protein